MSCIAREFERKLLETATCLLIFPGDLKELLIPLFSNMIVCVVN